MTNPRRVEYMPLATIAKAPRNPKQHDEAGIRRSVDRFGVAELPLLDERTGRLVAGHERLDDLTARHTAGEDPPDGVVVAADGTWTVPVVRGWSSRSDVEAEAYLLASNRLTINGGWDDDGVNEILADLARVDPDLALATGWGEDELEALLAGSDADGVGPLGSDPGPMPPPPDPVTTLGDLWLLGAHRLLCGDATDMAAVEAMLAGDRADCMWTDPPYGVAIVGGSHALSPAERLARGGKTIQNDASADDLPNLLAGAWAVATAALRPGAPVYIAHPDSYRAIFEQAMRDAGWLFRQNLIWVKDVLVLGRSDYHYRHEPILYGFTGGGDGRLGRGGERWYGDNAQTTVFEVPKPSRSEVHPTMKPVELITRMLTNSCPPGGLVYEPFGGSGSTLVAAHQLGMRAAVVELDPRYCDVICRRFQEYTGTVPARLLPDGSTVPHDFTAGG